MIVIIKAAIVGMIIGLLIEKIILKIRKKNMPVDKRRRRPKISHLFIALFVLFLISKVAAYFK